MKGSLKCREKEYFFILFFSVSFYIFEEGFYVRDAFELIKKKKKIKELIIDNK